MRSEVEEEGRGEEELEEAHKQCVRTVFKSPLVTCCDLSAVLFIDSRHIL